MHGFTSVAHRDAFVCHHNVNDGLAGSCVSCSDLQLCFNTSLYLTLHFPSVSEGHRGRYTVSWEVNDGCGESSFLTLEVTATTIESNNINLRLYPSHGNTCLENGSFLLNYVGCAKCNHRDFMLINNKTTEEEDGEEIVTYDHVCKNCHHIIARHEYTFSVVDDYQEYTMLCMLCGKAEDTISILPDDPRRMAPLF
ncbi:UNVERIFIED_CONTAM: hypothetical protein FKN15_076663 [Acipenser sinensis]